MPIWNPILLIISSSLNAKIMLIILGMMHRNSLLRGSCTITSVASAASYQIFALLQNSYASPFFSGGILND